MSGGSVWNPLRVQQHCTGSPCLQTGMLLWKMAMNFVIYFVTLAQRPGSTLPGPLYDAKYAPKKNSSNNCPGSGQTPDYFTRDFWGYVTTWLWQKFFSKGTPNILFLRRAVRETSQQQQLQAAVLETVLLVFPRSIRSGVSFHPPMGLHCL